MQKSLSFRLFRILFISPAGNIVVISGKVGNEKWLKYAISNNLVFYFFLTFFGHFGQILDKNFFKQISKKFLKTLDYC